MQVLLITTQFAGIVLLVGTLILLFFRRIYLDAETKQPIKFSLPLLGEVSTQAPVMVLVLVGAMMVVYPLSRGGPETASVEGEIDTGGHSVNMLIVADPVYTHAQDSAGAFRFEFPLLAGHGHYRFRYVVDKLIIADQQGELKNGRISLKPVQWAPPLPDGTLGAIAPRKEVSDEELRALAIRP